MNRSKIEYVDHTWNPITGCLHDCEYCYAKAIAKRFSGDIRLNLKSEHYEKQGELFILKDKFITEEGNSLAFPFGFAPTFHHNRLNYLEQLKSGFNVFVGAMADIFGWWMPDEYISKVFDECLKVGRHNYIFLTKNPARYSELYDQGILPLMTNFWYGSTVTRKSDPIAKLPGGNSFICIEPILEKPRFLGNDIKICDWIIVGAETGNRKGRVIPTIEWINKITDYADRVGIPVFMKDSLIEIMGSENMRQEFPEKLKHKERSKKVRERLEGDCAKCKVHMYKNEMIAIAARSKRGEMPKQLCHMCPNCFRDFCDSLEIRIPDLVMFKSE